MPASALHLPSHERPRPPDLRRPPRQAPSASPDVGGSDLATQYALDKFGLRPRRRRRRRLPRQPERAPWRPAGRRRRRRHAPGPLTAAARKVGCKSPLQLRRRGVRGAATIVTHRAYLRDHPDVIQRYVTAIIDATDYFKTDRGHPQHHRPLPRPGRSRNPRRHLPANPQPRSCSKSRSRAPPPLPPPSTTSRRTTKTPPASTPTTCVDDRFIRQLVDSGCVEPPLRPLTPPPTAPRHRRPGASAPGAIRLAPPELGGWGGRPLHPAHRPEHRTPPPVAAPPRTPPYPRREGGLGGEVWSPPEPPERERRPRRGVPAPTRRGFPPPGATCVRSAAHRPAEPRLRQQTSGRAALRACPPA